MKIGELTFHNTTNYGAMLQTYALQKTILKLGCDCEIIDYKNTVIEDRYRVKKISEAKNIKQLLNIILLNPIKKKLLLKFANFKEKNLILSKKQYNDIDIKETNGIYDKFIVGSDQVWNNDLNGNDTNYFLDFVIDENKKNSYAASFGYGKVPKKYVKNIQNSLNGYNKISVREKQAVALLSDMGIYNVKLVLDPTFLLNNKEWDSISKEYNKGYIKEKYILLYMVSTSPHIISFTRRLQKETGYKVIYLNSSFKKLLGFKNINGVGPEHFLSLIKNAEYVVTTSFHGVALSINYNKQFFYGLSDVKNNFNSRIVNIIDLFGLEDRKINLNSSISNVINYEMVNKILEEKREESLSYLKEILE